MEPATATMISAFVTSTLPFILKEVAEKIKEEDLETDLEFMQEELDYVQAAIKDYTTHSRGMELWKAGAKHLALFVYKMEDIIDSSMRHAVLEGVEKTKTQKLIFSFKGWTKKMSAKRNIKALRKKAEKGRMRWNSYMEVLKGQTTHTGGGGASSNNSASGAAQEDCPLEKFMRRRLGSLLSRSYFLVIDIMSSETMEWKTKQVDSKLLANQYLSLPTSCQNDCLLYFCMAPYFCMFPVGHRISRSSLIRRWQAEGLVPPDEDENATYCSEHGMMHRYMSQVCPSQSYIMCRDETPTPHIRRVSVHCYRGGKISASGSKSDLSRLRTLAVFPRNAERDAVDLSLNFSKHKLLRVLDLEECDRLDNRHLEGICEELVLLKYLSLGGNITEVPMDIERLQRLETLDLSRCRSPAVTVLAQVIKLPRLKHLLGKLQLRPGDVEGLDKFLQDKKDRYESMLKTVAGFVIDNRSGFPQLMAHMKWLTKVKIWCQSTTTDDNFSHHSAGIKGFCDIGSSLPGRSLSIDVRDCVNPEAFLNSLHDDRFKALHSLSLTGRLSGFPQFVAQLMGTTKLCLSSTNLSWLVIVDGIKNFTVLKYMKLVEHDPDDHIVMERDLLPSLQRICILGAERLPNVTIQDGALPNLSSLHLLCQGQGPDHIPDIDINRIHKLKEVVLHSGVPQATKDRWQDMAARHTNTPTVVFIDVTTPASPGSTHDPLLVPEINTSNS